ncbi:MAG: hypothetical protein FWG30_03745 [Eubacteriaceae bacterium]|nr:hypothetical protein [Eubacteriaceae bacterium]
MGRKPAEHLTIDKLKNLLTQIAQKQEKPQSELSLGQQKAALSSISRLPIEYEEMPRSESSRFDKKAGIIYINSIRPEKSQIKAIVHEICFVEYKLALATNKTPRKLSALDSQSLRYVAEAKGFALSAYLGISGSEYKLTGLSNWLMQKPLREMPEMTYEKKVDLLLSEATASVKAISGQAIQINIGQPPSDLHSKTEKAVLNKALEEARARKMSIYRASDDEPDLGIDK